ncbi:MAG: hypothetical protein ABEJ35_01690 [Halobacteriaceae archaeon]
MSREIRITVDDDEVFERMRRQKEALDLSWEEALRRGLQDEGHPEGSHEGLDPFADDFRDQLRDRIHRATDTTSSSGPTGSRDGDTASARAPERPDPSRSNFDPFDPDSIAAFARKQARAALDATAAGLSSPPNSESSLDSELDRLADAEDATLTFPFIEADGARVPLRVSLRTTGSGLEIDVVAVRQGKGTDEVNRFPGDTRQRVAAAMSEDATATVSLQDGAERYDVVPRLSWGRTDDGTPTVTDVEIERVALD